MLFLKIILLSMIDSSFQIIYSCNSELTCGCSSSPVSITRVVGGENASEASWGWAVSISVGNLYLCGGSILSSSWIITAAHCIENYTPKDFLVYAGSTLLWFGTQNRSVSQIIVHSKYDPATYSNDIALLRLSIPLIMSDPNVSPICIPSIKSISLTSNEFPTNGTTVNFYEIIFYTFIYISFLQVVAIGWGRLSENGPSSKTLQQVTLTIIDYRTITCSSVIYDQNIQMCAGMPGGGKGQYFNMILLFFLFK